MQYLAILLLIFTLSNCLKTKAAQQYPNSVETPNLNSNYQKPQVPSLPKLPNIPKPSFGLASFKNRLKETLLAPINVFLDSDDAKEESVINQQALVNGTYSSTQGQFQLKIAIQIPENSETVTVTSLDDELNNFTIEDIAWLVEEDPNKQFTHKLFKPRKILAIDKQKNINTKYESFTLDYDPDKAYDRITHNKHVIDNSFMFNKSDIFNKEQSKVANFLELSFSNGMKKVIRIEEKIYHDPFNSTMGSFANSNQNRDEKAVAKYQELFQGNQNLDTLLESEEVNDRLQDTGDGGYSPLEYKILPKAGIPAGDVDDYYTDDTPSGKDFDMSLLNIFDEDDEEE